MRLKLVRPDLLKENSGYIFEDFKFNYDHYFVGELETQISVGIMLPDWYRGLCTFFTNVPLINVYILPIKNGETEPVFIGVYEVQQVVPTVMTSFCLSMKDIEKISLIITLSVKPTAEARGI